MGSIGPSCPLPPAHTSQQPQSTALKTHPLSTSLPGSPPPLLILFSFLSPASHHWATSLRLTHHLRRSLPKGCSVVRYHISQPPSSAKSITTTTSTSVSAPDPTLGRLLTRAWAVSMSLNVDDRIIEPLFRAVLEEKRAHDLQGIREVFAGEGVDRMRFDRAWNSAEVEGLVGGMEAVEQSIGGGSVPCIVVDGREVVGGEEVERLLRGGEGDEGQRDLGERIGALVMGMREGDGA